MSATTAEPLLAALARPAAGVPVDSRTVVRAVAGNEGAFTDLYRQLHPRTLRYAATLVGPDAEDVTAEAWLQVAQGVHSFAGDLDAFRGWVATIVRHRALDHLRARARRPVVYDDVVTTLTRPAPDDTEHEVLTREATGRAVALIATLPPDQAEAVMLRAVMGLDVAATAALLGKRPGAVRVACHRGLTRLAQTLTQ